MKWTLFSGIIIYNKLLSISHLSHINQEKTWTDQDTPNLTHWSHRWQTGHTIMEERQGVAAFEQVKMIAQSSCFYGLTSVISLILIARFLHFY